MFSVIVYLRLIVRYTAIYKLYYYISYTLLVVLFTNLLISSYLTTISTKEAIIDILNNIYIKLLTKEY